MAPNRFMTDLDFTKTQLAVYYVVFLLSVDTLNPIKVLCHVVPGLEAWHTATLSMLLFVYVCFAQLKQLLYFATKMFFHSILSIFFREVQVIGLQNIPAHGPVIFAINHANQFVDAVMTLSTCQRNISYLMAEASYNRPIIGHIAFALGVVPVKRAQDDAKAGTGTIRMTVAKTNGGDGEKKTIAVKGAGSVFSQELAEGDKIRPPGTPVAFKVISVDSDTALTLEMGDLPEDYKFPAEEQAVKFDILKKVDTKIVFEKVLERLAAGGAVGIFPEGGSHDRTELLPLKVGIALVGYSALEKDGLNIPIVPVGLNYFRAHRWRGRAVVEYGKPILIDPASLKDYKAGGERRRRSCNKLLESIETAMRSVLVSAPDYESLELIHTARRLYKREKGPMDTSEKQDLSRRFAEGYKRLMLMTNGNPPKEWLDLQNRIVEYRNELKDLGLRDYQVPAITEEHLDDPIEKTDGNRVIGFLQILYQIVHLLALLALAAVPIVFLNLPVGLLAGIYAEQRRKRALSKSKVKIKGFDVMMTEKLVFCIVMVPSLWVFYALMLICFTDLDGPTIALIVFCFPIFAYMGIVVAEVGMVDLKYLRPYIMRLFPKTRRQLAILPEKRKALQSDLRTFIKSIGPVLGELYYEENLDWQRIIDKASLTKKEQ